MPGNRPRHHFWVFFDEIVGDTRAGNGSLYLNDSASLLYKPMVHRMSHPTASHPYLARRVVVRGDVLAQVGHDPVQHRGKRA